MHAQVVPTEQIHPELFKMPKGRFKNVPWAKLERKRHDKVGGASFQLTRLTLKPDWSPSAMTRWVV